MNENNFWDKFEEIEVIKEEEYGDLLQAKNKNTQKYIIIKRIDKSKYTNEYLSEINIMNKLKCENSISLIESFDTKDYYYIITDYYLMDLKEYMNKRNQGLSIEEIKEILIQLNNIFINNIDEMNLNLSNIVICLDKLNKTTFKLTNYKLIKKNLLYTPPEILENKLIDKTKINIWELGIIIYYLLFKEYPYNGKTEYQILNQINSNKILKNIHEKELNDLIYRMLKINENERITWNNYFNHNFFKKDSIKQKLIKENSELQKENKDYKAKNIELQKENKDYKTKNNDLMKKGEELKNKIE
jgi:serine/threonine protein kinase